MNIRKRNDILVIINGQIYPTSDGINLRAYNFVKNLCSHFSVDIICTGHSEETLHRGFNGRYHNLYLSNKNNIIPKRNNSLNKIIDLTNPPYYIYAIPMPYYENIEYLLASALSSCSYRRILTFGAPTYGYYLWKYKINNSICDVIDSTGLLLKTVLENKKISIKDRISYIYSYIYNVMWERRYLSKCENIITISKRDKRELALHISVDRIHVLENGVDHEYFDPAVFAPYEERDEIIFSGVMDYEPNHDAAVYLIKEIWPKLRKRVQNYKLKIIGRNPKSSLIDIAKNYKDVVVTGEVDDIRKEMVGAKVMICPIRLGAGMKNKILEAFAMGIPVVSTTEGAEGIDFENGKEGFITDNINEMTEHIERIVTNDKLRAVIKKNARMKVMSKYAWEQKTKDLIGILNIE